MTNAEKFEEVFGIKIEEHLRYRLRDLCKLISNKPCADISCEDCPAFRFWEREYKEEQNDQYKRSTV